MGGGVVCVWGGDGGGGGGGGGVHVMRVVHVPAVCHAARLAMDPILGPISTHPPTLSPHPAAAARWTWKGWRWACWPCCTPWTRSWSTAASGCGAAGRRAAFGARSAPAAWPAHAAVAAPPPPLLIAVPRPLPPSPPCPCQVVEFGVALDKGFPAGPEFRFHIRVAPVRLFQVWHRAGRQQAAGSGQGRACPHVLHARWDAHISARPSHPNLHRSNQEPHYTSNRRSSLTRARSQCLPTCWTCSCSARSSRRRASSPSSSTGTCRTSNASRWGPRRRHVWRPAVPQCRQPHDPSNSSCSGLRPPAP